MTVFQYVYTVDSPTTCAVFKYTIIDFIIIYSMLKATYLHHFAFLMYRTYTLRPYKEKNRKLLYCYGVVNAVAGTIGIVPMLVTVDLLHNKSAFALNNGYCANFFQESGVVANTVIIALLAIIIAVQIVFFIIALTLYFLTTKRFCTCGGDITGQPSNIRVSITLMSAIALGAILY